MHGAQVLRAEHEAGRAEVAEARTDKLATAKRVGDAVAERDLARQMLKGVQAMLGHAEAARSSAQRALQQAQAEKASSQVFCLALCPLMSATLFLQQGLLCCRCQGILHPGFENPQCAAYLSSRPRLSG